MEDDIMFFHFNNLQDDFIKYYQSTNKNRIDQVKLSRLSILYGASALYKRIQSIFQNESPKGIVICAHLKHSKLHDFYIIAASLIYGYTIFHSNWHTDGDESLAYKLKITKCRLVILDDELDSGWMIPDVKYIKISDVYTQSIYNKSLSLCSYLSLVDSLGKERSDARIQVMLNSQTRRVSEIQMDDVVMISFTEGKPNKKPKAKMITFREIYNQFKQLESLRMWKKDDILVVFITNPTYDWINCTILYYCLYRPNVYLYFMQRYMSTYWKILWEANEHAKSVYLQLGKSYKILNFLYPRQLEALFTLEEISHECMVFDDQPSFELPNGPEASSDEKESSFDTNQLFSSFTKISKTQNKLTSYFFGKRGLINNISPFKCKEDDKLSKQGSQLTLSPDSVKPIIKRPSKEEEKAKPNLYITKLHLKLSEMTSVLSDDRVELFLSGSHTDYNLTKMFSKVFKGKVPVVVYGSCEITPLMTITEHPVLNEEFIHFSKMGSNNSFQDKQIFGYYIGNSKNKSLQLRVVKSVTQGSEDFMVKCEEGEPGFIVCDVTDKSCMLLDPNEKQLFYNDTYIGLDDIGFYYKCKEGQVEHFYWIYNLNSSITKDLTYPYTSLIGTSKMIQKSICLRYGLNTSVVRVETVELNMGKGEKKVVCVIELITALKPEISQDIRSGFLKTCQSVGLFNSFIVPSEIRIISIPWTYKGCINYPVLIVRGIVILFTINNYFTGYFTALI